MESLADNVLVQIFNYLPPDPEQLLKLRNVSWRWRDLTQVKALWNNVELEFSTADINKFESSVPYKCLKVAPVLRSLLFDHLEEEDSKRVTTAILHYHPREIRKLAFSNTCIEAHHFTQLLGLFQNQLEELIISFELSVCEPAPEYKLYLYDVLPKLKKLHTTSDVLVVKGLTDPPDDFCPCPNLEEIRIYNCNRELGFLSDNEVKLIVSSQASLRRIDIDAESPLPIDGEPTLPVLVTQISSILQGNPGFKELEEITFRYFSYLPSLKWKLGTSVGVDLVFDDMGARCLGGGCENCLWLAAIESFDSLSDLTIQFCIQGLRCISHFLKSAGALKVRNKLTLYDSKRHASKTCGCLMQAASAGSNVAIHQIIRHAADHCNLSTVKIFSVKGCSTFLSYPWRLFKVRFPHLGFEFKKIRDHE